MQLNIPPLVLRGALVFAATLLLIWFVWAGNGMDGSAGWMLLSLMVCYALLLHLELRVAKKTPKKNLRELLQVIESTDMRTYSGEKKPTIGGCQSEESAVLSAISQKRKEDIAHFSHELRTPLSTIINNIELLQNTGQDPHLNKSLQRIERAAKRIAALTDFVLSENLTNNVSLETQSFSLNRLIEDVLRDIGGIRGDRVRVSTSLNGAVLNENKTACWIILNNVIANAIKHTGFGWVRITTNGHNVLVENEEQGGEDVLDVTFNHSFGLGMTISEKAAARIGAVIELVSEENRWVVSITFRDNG